MFVSLSVLSSETSPSHSTPSYSTLTQGYLIFSQGFNYQLFAVVPPISISELNLSPERKIHLANCLLSTTPGMSSRYLKINTFKTEPIIVYSRNYSSSSVSDTSIHSVIQAKNTGVILVSSLSPNLPHRPVATNHQCYLLPIYWVCPLLPVSTGPIISLLNGYNSLISGPPDLDFAPVHIQSQQFLWSTNWLYHSPVQTLQQLPDTNLD